MSQLLKRVKEEGFAAIKEHNTIKKNIISLIVDYAYKTAKESQREVTDDDVLKGCKKVEKGILETKELVKNNLEQVAICNMELAIVRSFIPKELSEDELRTEVKNIIKNNDDVSKMGKKAIGFIMNMIKERHPNKVDGKIASKIINEEISLGV